MRARPLSISVVNRDFLGGGAERCARDIFFGMRARGHVTSFYRRQTHGDASLGGGRIPGGAFDKFVSRAFSGALGLTDVVAPAPLVSALRGSSFAAADVIHAHNLHGSRFNLLALPVVARRSRLVLTLHDQWLLAGDCLPRPEDCERWLTGCGHCPLKAPSAERGDPGLRRIDLTALNWRLKRALFTHTPRERVVLVSPSRWLAEQVARSYLAPLACEVVPNGVDLAAFFPEDRASCRAQLRLGHESFVIVAVAANWDTSYKGSALIAALARALGTGAEVIVVGSSSPATRRQFDEARVRTLGPLADVSDLRRAISAADVALVASTWENLPYAVSEALACGVPVVARRVGGIPEMLNDDVGTLVGPDAHAAEFADAIRAYETTAETRGNRRAAARAHAQRHFDREHMLTAYERIYYERPSQGWRGPD